MKKQVSQLTGLFIRYVIILVAGLGNLYILYKLLKPLTIHAVAALMSLFTHISISDNLIISERVIIEIIPACVAGSAYYLLLILVLATPKINLSKRIKILAFTFLALFILNIARIIILASTTSSTYFHATHLIFWYFISTIFVAGIWIASVRLFKIKSTPIYDDLKFLYKLIKSKKKK
ncbi:hypothetical protein CMI37_26545 [Candidatus Pacearchaeota archaeon]|nr:hypothetical protein [Candidatus Pacearchaeota archaeon]|tara:strand:+ start:2408 stop:2941 length:534 start_codon:yes stop_codon:yes gene_type:complete